MQPLTFITLGNTQSSDELRVALVGTGRARLLAGCEKLNETFEEVLRLRPSAAIITVGLDDSEREFALIKELVKACPQTAIVTAARDASPALILGSMRAGAREFLQLPIMADEFRTVMERVSEFCATVESSARNGRTIAIFSGKGGAGVSFFSTNLAAAMDVSTLLVDLNLQSGDAASFLGLDTKYSLIDFVRNRARLDDALINSFVTPHSARLSLLAAPIEAHDAEDIQPHDVSEALHLLGQRYDCMVLDLQHTFDPITVAALDLADDILVLLTLDIPGIRSAKRALKIFERLGYPRQKIRLVINRWSKNIDVELKKVEAHLDEQLIGFVPNDYRKVMESINLGKPLVQADPGSKITTEIRRIANMVVDKDQPFPPQKRKRSLSTLLGRQSGTTSLELATVPETA